MHAILSLLSQPCPTVLHRAFPWYWPVHPDIYGFAFYAFYALHCLLFSSSEDAISRASLRTLLAPPWASILLGIRCFATMPHSKFLSLCMPYFPYFRNHAPRCSTGLFHGTGRPIQTYMALPSMPSMPCIAFCLAVPKMLFRERLCARFWHRLGLQSCWGSGVSQPCPTVLHRAFPWYWPVHPDSYGFAFYAFYALHMPCIAFCLAVPKHASGTALGFNPAGDPVFRNHASQYSTRLFHGTGRSIQTSMALPCMPCIHPDSIQTSMALPL